MEYFEEEVRLVQFSEAKDRYFFSEKVKHEAKI